MKRENRIIEANNSKLDYIKKLKNWKQIAVNIDCHG